MEEKHPNTKSHTCLRLDMSHSWSELPLDLLSLVFERLSYANFQRAKTVCSSWCSASRQSVPKKNQIHWMILFPQNKDENNNMQDNKNSSCMLFNPEEKDKLYKTQDLGVEFAKSECIATYGSWLLMQDLRDNLYIMNIFTLERIDLPSAESQLGMVKVERTIDDSFHISDDYNEWKYENMDIRSPVFWIDDKTKDYVVLWGLGFWCVAYSNKGDNLWNQIPDISDCAHMFYKDHKLYLFSYRNIFTIIDFSGEIPQETDQCGMFAVFDVFCLGSPCCSWVINSQLVVTVTGDVLKVDLLWSKRYRTYSFLIFKVYSSGFLEKIELINSLGDESMLLNQGITVLANDTNGFIRNSIYFSGIYYEKNTNDVFIFNLKTLKTELLHTFDTFDSSSLQFSRPQWFFPSCTHA